MSRRAGSSAFCSFDILWNVYLKGNKTRTCIALHIQSALCVIKTCIEVLSTFYNILKSVIDITKLNLFSK